MSQTELGKNIGVSFQQIQKYEQGTNRVGGGRLHQIAAALDVPVSTFFEGAASIPEKNVGSSPIALLSESYALRLLTAFAEIDDLATRRSVVDVVEKLADMAKTRTERKPATPRVEAARSRATQ
jgi:transcriptional regulator with XRE-family HTH domain